MRTRRPSYRGSLFAASLALVFLAASWRPGDVRADDRAEVPTEARSDDPAAEALRQLEELDLVALATAERRAVVRQGDDLHVVMVGDSLPGVDGSWLRQVRADRLTVQLPGGAAAHWFAERAGGEGRIEVLRPTAPSDSIPPSPPYLIPIRRAEDPSADPPPAAPSNADEEGIRP